MDKELLKKNLLKKIEDFDNKDHNRESERDICRAYIEPLFSYLGWHMDDTDEVKEQKDEPEGRPDYIFYLNSSIALFLETKKVKVIDEKDIKQALNYGRSRNKRWSILSNFEETIILICDTKETSLSNHIFRRISYKNMIENLDSLLLLSRESFENGIIDAKAQDEGRIKKTIRIDEELLNDILLWRKELIKSIKNENKKEYSKETLEEIAQILLNRIIFIRTVEDRRIEAQPDETIKSILNQYENNKSVKIKDKLNRLFEEYDKTYDSKLFTYDEHNFANRHESENVEIDNKTYYKILKETYEKNEIYSYKFGDIDADILGEMYERYIGNIQDFKKKQGIYYTPTWVVDYIVKNTIGDMFENKSKKAISELRVLDMACGSGSFLLKAFDSFNEHYKLNKKKYFQSGLDLENETARITQKTKILKEHIFGVDLDIKAVEIAQLNLLLKIAETKHRLPDVRNNIKQGNSLIADESVAGKTAFNWNEEFTAKFDIVMGNPPYVRMENIAIPDRLYYKKTYEFVPGRFDIYSLFLEKGLKLLKKGGYLGFIIPNTFINNDDFWQLRKFILENYNLKHIAFLGYGVFGDATVSTIILIIQLPNELSEPKRNKTTVSYGVKAGSKQMKVKQTQFLENEKFRLNVQTDDVSQVLKKCLNGSADLEKEIDFVSGIQVWSKEADRLKNPDLLSKKPLNKGYKKTIVGKNIEKYSIRFDEDYVLYDKKLLERARDEGFFLAKEKILMRYIGTKIICAYDNEQYYAQKSVIIIFPKTNSKIKIKYLLAILNSKLFQFLYDKKVGDEPYPRINLSYILKLPIKLVSDSEQDKVIQIVDKIMAINKRLEKIEQGTNDKINLERERNELLDKIDANIYTIYGISNQEEIDLIKGD